MEHGLVSLSLGEYEENNKGHSDKVYMQSERNKIDL